MSESVLAAAEHYEYWGGDFNRRWRVFEPGITGYLGGFVIGSQVTTYSVMTARAGQ